LALNLLPETIQFSEDNRYQQLLQTSCFVAGLTDGQALRWHKKLA
jgi:hypothetical protein